MNENIENRWFFILTWPHLTLTKIDKGKQDYTWLWLCNINKKEGNKKTINEEHLKGKSFNYAEKNRPNIAIKFKNIKCIKQSKKQVTYK